MGRPAAVRCRGESSAAGQGRGETQGSQKSFSPMFAEAKEIWPSHDGADRSGSKTPSEGHCGRPGDKATGKNLMRPFSIDLNEEVNNP